MTLRDQLQDKWAIEFMDAGGKGILHLCPRSGKTRTAIRIFCKIQRLKAAKSAGGGKYPKILICYPDKNIQQSWESDFKAVGYKNPNISYVTHVSIHKEVNNQYDIIVCDEIHLLSVNQMSNFNKLQRNSNNSYILGLSGTLSKGTKLGLEAFLGLEVISEYSLEQAIKDGIISDYRITVLTTDLDNKTIVDLKKKKTEKQKFNALSYVIEKKGPSLFLNLSRMRIIYNSISKLQLTKDLLKSLKGKRVLVFCANNKVAKQLSCKVHTSKDYDQEEFNKFISNNSNFNHIAVCKIGNTGISFRDLSNIIINAFDSNSENLTQRICRSLILDEPGKISNIYIISSTEEVELKWLQKSLEFFEKGKIKYL
jgi:superfamily II DNA or RNA helicase